jgi:hypothetical protein
MYSAGRDEKCEKIFSPKAAVDHWGGLGVDARSILKLTIKKQDVTV